MQASSPSEQTRVMYSLLCVCLSGPCAADQQCLAVVLHTLGGRRGLLGLGAVVYTPNLCGARLHESHGHGMCSRVLRTERVTGWHRVVGDSGLELCAFCKSVFALACGIAFASLTAVVSHPRACCIPILDQLVSRGVVVLTHHRVWCDVQVWRIITMKLLALARVLPSGPCHTYCVTVSGGVRLGVRPACCLAPQAMCV